MIRRDTIKFGQQWRLPPCHHREIASLIRRASSIAIRLNTPATHDEPERLCANSLSNTHRSPPERSEGNSFLHYWCRINAGNDRRRVAAVSRPSDVGHGR